MHLAHAHFRFIPALAFQTTHSACFGIHLIHAQVEVAK